MCHFRVSAGKPDIMVSIIEVFLSTAKRIPKYSFQIPCHGFRNLSYRKKNNLSINKSLLNNVGTTHHKPISHKKFANAEQSHIQTRSESCDVTW
jgi:hypothetical protein